MDKVLGSGGACVGIHSNGVSILKLLILIIAVLALGSRLVPALSWLLAFFILLMLADLLRSELRKHLGRHRRA